MSARVIMPPAFVRGSPDCRSPPTTSYADGGIREFSDSVTRGQVNGARQHGIRRPGVLWRRIPHGCGKAAQQCGEPRGVARRLGVCPLDGVVQRHTGEHQDRTGSAPPSRVSHASASACSPRASSNRPPATVARNRSPATFIWQRSDKPPASAGSKVARRANSSASTLSSAAPSSGSGARLAQWASARSTGSSSCPRSVRLVYGGGSRRSQAPSAHQAVGFELAQPLREELLAHLRQPAVQVGVALRAEDQFPHDVQRPPLADRVQRSRDAAGVVEQPLLAHAPECTCKTGVGAPILGVRTVLTFAAVRNTQRRDRTHGKARDRDRPGHDRPR